MIESRQVPLYRNGKVFQPRIAYEIDELYLFDPAQMFDRQEVESLSDVLFGVCRKRDPRLVFDLYFGDLCGLLTRSLYCHNFAVDCNWKGSISKFCDTLWGGRHKLSCLR